MTPKDKDNKDSSDLDNTIMKVTIIITSA